MGISVNAGIAAAYRNDVTCTCLLVCHVCTEFCTCMVATFLCCWPVIADGDRANDEVWSTALGESVT